MQGKWKTSLGAEDGAIALEACLSLTLFLIVMLALYNIVSLFTVQSMISHSLQQAGQSISLENYKNEKTSIKTLQAIPLHLIQKITDGISTSSNQKIDVGGGSFTDSTKVSGATISKVAQQRFASYLGGNSQNADKILRSMGVVNGMQGISFQKCRVDGNDIILEISYKVRLVFYLEMFHFGEFESTQTVCSRLWK